LPDSASGKIIGCTLCPTGASRAITSFYFAFIGAFSPYFGLYLQSLNFSAWDIGLLMSQMQLMRLFGPNLWGWLADRFGRRMMIIRLAGADQSGRIHVLFSGWINCPGCCLQWRRLPFSGAQPCRSSRR
jgi:MFS family permease